jgi:hypothetical protein
MTSLVKRTKRSFKRVTLGWRESLMARTPAWAKRAFGPTMIRLDSLLVDHGFIRLIYLNRHRVGDRAWRAAQPGVHHFRSFAAQGIKTIVNLRGPRVCGSYWLEQDACRELGLVADRLPDALACSAEPRSCGGHGSCSTASSTRC